MLYQKLEFDLAVHFCFSKYRLCMYTFFLYGKAYLSLFSIDSFRSEHAKILIWFGDITACQFRCNSCKNTFLYICLVNINRTILVKVKVGKQNQSCSFLELCGRILKFVCSAINLWIYILTLIGNCSL